MDAIIAAVGALRSMRRVETRATLVSKEFAVMRAVTCGCTPVIVVIRAVAFKMATVGMM